MINNSCLTEQKKSKSKTYWTRAYQALCGDAYLEVAIQLTDQIFTDHPEIDEEILYCWCQMEIEPHEVVELAVRYDGLADQIIICLSNEVETAGDESWTEFHKELVQQGSSSYRTSGRLLN